MQRPHPLQPSLLRLPAPNSWLDIDLLNWCLSGEGHLSNLVGPVSVLLVEDDLAIAEMYRMQLEADGYRVTIAPTGEEAWAEIQRGRHQLVLLDIRLPGMDGFGVMNQMRSQSPRPLPVVFLTNYGDPKMMEAGLRLGAVDYIVKSRITPAELSKSIPGWLSRARGSD